MIVLIFSTYFVPGYRGGGPIRSIQNLVEHLGNEFNFKIICSDRDLGDSTAYPNVTLDQWVKVGNANVFYASPKYQTIKGLFDLIKNTPHDVIYLNSVFTWRFSLVPLLFNRFLGIGSRAVILAPRGEFSLGALAIKKIKKNIFLFIAKKIALYNNIIWQASSDHEASDIIRVMGRNNRPHIGIASDLSKIVTAPNLTSNSKSKSKSKSKSLIKYQNTSDPDVLKLLFLSRLSPKKNLDFALSVLGSVSVKTTFDIFGPKEDLSYWEKCEKIFSVLPSHITVRYLGVATPEEVPQIMSNYDIFFFPTHGENFGHVIFEALAVGTPVLISDRTPWRNLSTHGAGWDLPLNSHDDFASILNSYAMLPSLDKCKLRESTARYATQYLQNNDHVNANRQLFINAISN